MKSIEFPLLDRITQNSVISTTSNDFSNWSRLSSLWPLLYGTSCCFIEFASLIGSRFDFDRYGLVPRSSPRQADLILTAGTYCRGVDKLIPVDVYLPGCPPKPEAVIDGITKLRKKISREIYEDRIKSQQTNRCFTIKHKFGLGRKIRPETFFKYKKSVSSPEFLN
ncbi:hypothetical protein RND81_O117300 [Saponaria officinalis]|uniref:NADH:ubiquinone oxidoreductase-like 20kDa subunit domain-containing protein n=1 Tax=Saponaria officinalis TaxID=3572 RepID=A0AAW1GD96_SAPOF